MADRKVTHSGKGENKIITKLCHPGEVWSPRYKDPAISDIKSRTHTYYVQIQNHRADVHVVRMPNGEEHLRTDPDGQGNNNLEDLPDC